MNGPIYEAALVVAKTKLSTYNGTFDFLKEMRTKAEEPKWRPTWKQLIAIDNSLAAGKSYSSSNYGHRASRNVRQIG